MYIFEKSVSQIVRAKLLIYTKSIDFLIKIETFALASGKNLKVIYFEKVRKLNYMQLLYIKLVLKRLKYLNYFQNNSKKLQIFQKAFRCRLGAN